MIEENAKLKKRVREKKKKCRTEKTQVARRIESKHNPVRNVILRSFQSVGCLAPHLQAKFRKASSRGKRRRHTPYVQETRERIKEYLQRQRERFYLS